MGVVSCVTYGIPVTAPTAISRRELLHLYNILNLFVYNNLINFCLERMSDGHDAAAGRQIRRVGEEQCRGQDQVDNSGDFAKGEWKSFILYQNLYSSLDFKGEGRRAGGILYTTEWSMSLNYSQVYLASNFLNGMLSEYFCLQVMQ